MKIICVDKTASDRLKLQSRIEEAFESNRNILGHLPVAEVVPASKEEIMFCSQPEIVIFGPCFLPDDVFTLALELREKFNDISIFIILSSDYFSLRTLRRFEQIATEVFSEEEQLTKLLHGLSRWNEKKASIKPGTLIVLNGVKGGVGTTSLVGGLGHACQTLGKSAVLVDLSQRAALIHFMGTLRRHSPDFATLLNEKIFPDTEILNRCLSTAPNGLTMLLPPSGATDIRELWLRDPKSIEISLEFIELLKSQFDTVIVDAGGAEGLLPFALNARANFRLLVTSNEPASVHLLNRCLPEICDIPGKAEVLIVCNLLSNEGLRKQDIFDFLYINSSFKESMSRLNPIPYDHRGRNWIGTGNTFYTESSTNTQKSLENIINLALNLNLTAQADSVSSTPKILNLLERILKQKVLSDSLSEQRVKLNPPRVKLLTHSVSKVLNKNVSVVNEVANSKDLNDVVYEPPSTVDNPSESTISVGDLSIENSLIGRRGSMSLEQLLFVLAALAIAASTWQGMSRNTQGVLVNFVESINNNEVEHIAYESKN